MCERLTQMRSLWGRTETAFSTAAKRADVRVILAE